MSAPNRMAVGVVVERRKAASQWIDYVWQPVSVLPGRPEAEPWTVLSQEAERTIFYAGTTTIELYLPRPPITATILLPERPRYGSRCGQPRRIRLTHCSRSRRILPKAKLSPKPVPI